MMINCPSPLHTELLQAFQSVTLDEMGKVRLMNRVDTKYVTTFRQIEALLMMAWADYLIQSIGDKNNMPYYTRYFDTSDTLMFYQHQRGKKARQKIRIRLYEGSTTLPFIEVKTKNNKGRTDKKRILMEQGTDLTPYDDFIKEHSTFTSWQLAPQIENHFYRVTLVNKAMTERITIDTGIEFHNFKTGRCISMPHIGIIEWKRNGLASRSLIDRFLKELRIKPAGFSKYCIGMAMTDPDLRQNRLKQKLRMINNICAASDIANKPCTDSHLKL